MSRRIKHLQIDREVLILLLGKSGLELPEDTIPTEASCDPTTGQVVITLQSESGGFKVTEEVAADLESLTEEKRPWVAFARRMRGSQSMKRI